MTCLTGSSDGLPRTAWTDKQLAYEIVNGPSGSGLNDLYAPEINSIPVPLPSVPGYHPLPDQSAVTSGDDWTTSFESLFDSTLIIVSAKHGQSPIDPRRLLRIDADDPGTAAPSSVLSPHASELLGRNDADRADDSRRPRLDPDELQAFRLEQTTVLPGIRRR